VKCHNFTISSAVSDASLLRNDIVLYLPQIPMRKYLMGLRILAALIIVSCVFSSAF